MVSKAEINFVRSLAERKVRDEHGLFVVEGRKMVAEALASGWTVRNIYEADASAFQRDAHNSNGGRLQPQRVSPAEIERMSTLKTPQGVLAVVEQAHFEKPIGGLILALDGIQDPGNLGTIMRTADWFGIGHIMCSPKCADRFNPKAVQASMGAVFRISVSYGSLEFPVGEEVYGTFMDGESIYDAPLTPDGIIVLGSEGRGISPQVAARVTRRIAIPSLSPRAESLNVAAAAAIVCAEFRRRG